MKLHHKFFQVNFEIFILYFSKKETILRNLLPYNFNKNKNPAQLFSCEI